MVPAGHLSPQPQGSATSFGRGSGPVSLALFFFFKPGDARQSDAHSLGTANQLPSRTDCNYFWRIDSPLFPPPKRGTRQPIHAPGRVRALSRLGTPGHARARTAPLHPTSPGIARARTHTHRWAALRWSSKAVDLPSQHPGVEVHLQRCEEIADSEREAVREKRCWFQS